MPKNYTDATPFGVLIEERADETTRDLRAILADLLSLCRELTEALKNAEKK